MNPITQRELAEFCAQRYGNQAWLARRAGYTHSSISDFLRLGCGLGIQARINLAQTIAQHQRQHDDRRNSMTFEGSPCRNCGGTLRYTKGRQCTHCQRKKCLEQYHSRKNQESKR